MKTIIITFFLWILILPTQAQEEVEVKINRLKSDYIPDPIIVTLPTKVLEDKLTGLKANIITVYKETRYFEYTLLDSIFSYDSLLPVTMADYTISDRWGDYLPTYSYDGYDSYANSNSDSNADNNYNYDETSYSENNGENSQYDDEYQADYQADGVDSTETEEENTNDLFLAADTLTKDSTYVFISNSAGPVIYGEIPNNFGGFIYERIGAYDYVKAHKIHKISILEVKEIVNADTVTTFKLETVTWKKIRELPLKDLVHQKLSLFNKADRVYQDEMKMPLTYQEILKIVQDTVPKFKITHNAIDSLNAFNIDPQVYLADIVWISFLIPYYKANIPDPYLRELFSKELTKKMTNKIIDLKEVCGYDFRKDPSFKNIIQQKTIYRNERFERTIDEEKKIPIITDHSQLAFNVTESLNPNTGRMEYEHAGVMSTIYETEEVSLADPQTGQPIKLTTIKIDPKTNKPILLPTASFGITFTQINLESLISTTKNMKYDLSKLVRNRTFINQKYTRTEDHKMRME